VKTLGEIVDFPKRQPMRTDTTRVTVTLPVHVVEVLKEQAQRQGVTLAHLIARRLGADPEQLTPAGGPPGFVPEGGGSNPPGGATP
jgi:hypothetical protein